MARHLGEDKTAWGRWAEDQERPGSEELTGLRMGEALKGMAQAVKGPRNQRQRGRSMPDAPARPRELGQQHGRELCF